MKLKIFFLLILLSTACNLRVNESDKDDPVIDPSENEDFEMLTWNIENFPKEGFTTINSVKNIIRDLNVDLIAVQEIADVNSFEQLLDSLQGWNGFLSNDQYSSGSYQKTGILYKSSFINIPASSVKNIFTDNGYAFPRPPLTAYVEITDLDSIKYDFQIIVVHLKALGGQDNEDRRRAACEQLEDYVKMQISSGADPDIIILGDWNDELDDPTDENVFETFLKLQNNYRFLTQSLNQVSYISQNFNSLIDHILITGDSFKEYGNGQTSVQYLDSQYSGYVSNVSDHRPVLATFKGFKIRTR